MCQAQEGRRPLLNVDFSALSLQKAFNALADSAERKRRLGPRGRVDLASPGLGEGKASNIHHLWLCCSEQSHGSATPAARLPPGLRVWDSRDREVSCLQDSRWFKQAYILHQNTRVCFRSGSSSLDNLCTFLRCLNLRIRPSPLQIQTFDHST